MESVFMLLSNFTFKITIHGDNPLQENIWTVNEAFHWLNSFKKINPNTDDTIIEVSHPDQNK